MAKQLVTLCKDSKGSVSFHYDVFIKSIYATSYYIDDDYDFGSIDPEDILVQMYTGCLDTYPGIIPYALR